MSSQCIQGGSGCCAAYSEAYSHGQDVRCKRDTFTATVRPVAVRVVLSLYGTLAARARVAVATTVSCVYSDRQSRYSYATRNSQSHGWKLHSRIVGCALQWQSMSCTFTLTTAAALDPVLETCKIARAPYNVDGNWHASEYIVLPNSYAIDAAYVVSVCRASIRLYFKQVRMCSNYKIELIEAERCDFLCGLYVQKSST